MKKLTLLSKVGITIAGISVVGASILGLAFGIGANSQIVKGYTYTNNLEDLKTNFDLTSKARFLTPDKQKYITAPLKQKKEFTNNFDAFEYVLTNGTKFKNFDEFFQWYIKEYQTTPILQIQKGEIYFNNEYPELLSPYEFLKFSDWFVKNVSWGADVLEMKTFSVVKGVEKSGNSVTLGSWKNNKKETNEINFFLDAFFGSMSIYSEYSGKGNHDDSVALPLNKNAINLEEMNELLSQVPLVNLRNFKVSNDNDASISRLFASDALENVPKEEAILDSMANKVLKGKEVWVYNQDKKVTFASPFKKEYQKNATLENTVGFIYDGQLSKEAVSQQIKKEINYINSFFGSNNPHSLTFKEDLLVKKTIKEFDSTKQYTFIDFGQKPKDWYLYSRPYFHKYDDNVTHKNLTEMINALRVDFKDFYGINQLKNKTIAAFHKSNAKNDFRFFKDKTTAVLTNPGIQASLIKDYKVEDVSVNKQKLTIKLKDEAEQIKYYELDAKDNSYPAFRSFFDLKQAVDYVPIFEPVAIKSSIETKLIPDKKTSEPEDKFVLYTSRFPGLMDRINSIYPHLTSLKEGHYIEKTLSDSGSYNYKIEKGLNKNWTIEDSISIAYLMKASSENFNGISADFLKFVGAHEYGHHQTLQAAKNISSDDPVVIGATNTGFGNGGASIDNYHNSDVLRMYLQARSNLDFDRINAQGKEDPKGRFLRFKWKDSKTGEWIQETPELIYGTTDDDPKNKNKILSATKRRFVQTTFEDFEKAAKERNSTTADLYLMNAFDNISATLSPGYELEFIEFLFQNPDGTEEFKVPTLKEFLSRIKDGEGNDLVFPAEDVEKPKETYINVLEYLTKLKNKKEGEEISIVSKKKQSEEDKFVLRVVWLTKESADAFRVDKVLKDKNGLPLINVKEGQILSAKEKEIVDKQVKLINQKFKDLLKIQNRKYSLPGLSSDSVDDYIATRKEGRLNDKFADYTFTYSEVLTRDYLQISYLPSKEELKDSYPYLQGVSEFNVNNEYNMLNNETDIWNKTFVDLRLLINSLIYNNKYESFQKANDSIAPHDYAIFYTEYLKTLDKLRLEYAKYDKNQITLKKYSEISTEFSIANQENTEKLFNSIFYDKNKNTFEDHSFYVSTLYLFRTTQNRTNFLGKVLSQSDGWFQDRMYRKKLGWELYNSDGTDKEDSTIRLTDIYNKPITHRARAMWQFLLKSNGINQRTLSGIWRSRQKDAIALYGYLKIADAQKVKQIAFENRKTKEVKYVDVKTNNTSNLFYYQKQGDASSKHTLKDEGFTSWVSDYFLASGYDKDLLKIGDSYNAYFVDANKNKISATNNPLQQLSLGDKKYLAENGKTIEQSPTYFENIDNDLVIHIKKQFNTN